MSPERVPVNDPEVLQRILANADAVLLDFDGPICDVFAGFPAHLVADQLRRVLAEGGYDELPAQIEKTEDPFDVLYYAATLGDDEAEYVEASQRAHEVEAVASSEPTPGAHDFIRAWHASGRVLAVVSNNSAAAVEAYLHLHELTACVDYVSARADSDSSRLKPSPFLLQQASEHLKITAARGVLIGDSLTDIQAAHAAGARVIGYANRPGKVDLFASEMPQAIVTDLTYLNSAL
ncbi:HAD family hydrolase [Lentzea flava]|uniref:Hydrolase n=1 Tax=Lentzea flava TaxID=103732 RepID=A0ABQ2UFC5_9PSEU|nr:HAD family phosphatase [Lentzea flava]MCP2198653.1 haloacid dehalogenase superfamily, subfamily IA, variant 3 with third motif having DD or ED [Lentzea flava]GGU29140.1 hydrolase [Lentzea flava]